MRNKLIFKVLTLMVTICVLSSIALSSFAATESDKAALQQKIDNVKKQQEEIKNNKENAKTDLEKINDQVEEIQNDILLLKYQIDDSNSKIQDKQDDIAKEEKEIDAKNELLKQRMVSLYEAGDTSYLDVLFNSDNLIDFMSGYSTIQTILEADTNLINELEDKKTQLEQDKKTLESAKQEVENLKAEKEIKNANLVEAQKNKENQIAKLSDEEKVNQQKLDDYYKKMKKVIDDLANQWKKAQEELKKHANDSGSSGSYVPSTVVSNGMFIWPCKSNTVTSGMKIRWGRWHKGIDINANFESVYAAASGVAYTNENPGGYGHYVIVYHKDGYATLYGHLSAYHVSNGQYVSQGTVIATSGNSGNNVTHLHFEIRKATSSSDFFGQNWLNPLNFYSGGYTLASGALTPSYN